jgi:nucleotide-binding universal stress UspA family protein
MDLATSLSQQEQSMLHVVHVWSSVRETFLGHARLSEADIERLKQELIAQRRRELSELIEGYALRSIDSRVHFMVDEPNVAIPRLAEQENIELVVMGTVCRTGLPGLLIGNTAENILGQVDCSILAVKPEGFVSPVK